MVSAPRPNRPEQALSRIYRPRVVHKINLDESPRLVENFFSTLKTELVYRNSWRTRDEAENAPFAYIDAWYNTNASRPASGGDHRTSTRPFRG